MKNYISLAILSVASLSSTAFAKDGLFVQASGGITHMGRDLAESDSGIDSAAIYGAGIGYNFGKFSASATVDMLEAVSSADRNARLNISTVLLNGAYNFTSASKLTPFVGAGIGMTLAKQGEISIDTDSDGINDTTVKPNYESSFVYEIQGGAKYAVSENVSVLGSLSYRNYLRTRAFDTTTYGDSSVGLEFFAAKVGVQYNF